MIIARKLPLIIFSFLMFSINLANAGERPSIADHLPSSFSEGDQVFKQRVLEQFGQEKSSQSLKKRLQDMKFDVAQNSDGQMMASYEENHMVCTLMWRIFWSSQKDDEIKNLGAMYGSSCL